MPVETRPDVDASPDTDEPHHAHIVKVAPGESAVGQGDGGAHLRHAGRGVVRARWVPSRDPKQLPMCQECKSIYELYRSFNDGLRDTPDD